MESKKCISIKKDGSQCTKNAKQGEEKCGIHLKSKINKTDELEKKQCISIKRDGTQCTKNVKQGEEMCLTHLNQEKRKIEKIKNDLNITKENMLNMTLDVALKKEKYNDTEIIDYKDLTDKDEIMMLEYIQTKINITFMKRIYKSINSNIYSIKDNKDNMYYAMKLYYYDTINNNHLKYKKRKENIHWEYILYNKLQNKDNIINLHSEYQFRQNKYNDFEYSYIIMDLYFENLNERLNKYDNKLSPDKIKKYINNIFNTIKNIHDEGYIYNNIALSNFMFDSPDSENITFIDLGIAEKYIDTESKHKKAKKHDYNVKNHLFTSIESNKSKSSNRYGDLQSLGYLLMYLYEGKLPWDEKTNMKTILKLKKNLFELEYFTNLPINIQEYMRLSYSGTHTQRPEYSEFTKLLN